MSSQTLTAAAPGSTGWTDAAGRLAGRLLIGGVFVAAGLQKLANYEGTQGYMAAMGVDAGLLPLVVALEVGAGLALMLGLFTRLAALALAGFTLMATVVFHADMLDPMQQILMMKNLMVTGGLLVVAAVGAGAWSIDARRAGSES